MLGSFIFILAALLTSVSYADNSPEFKSARIAQARELMGKHFAHSPVKATEKLTNPEEFVLEQVKLATHKLLSRSQALRVARTISTEARRYGFDPLFLLAVIQSESSFRPKMRGDAGELGLMQILPKTGKWVAEKYGLSWQGKKSLLDPAQNIRIGAAYFAHLRDRFKNYGRLYLAAYNMGSLNVKRSLSNSIVPKDYPIRVMKNYVQYYRELKTHLEKEAS